MVFFTASPAFRICRDVTRFLNILDPIYAYLRSHTTVTLEARRSPTRYRYPMAVDPGEVVSKYRRDCANSTPCCYA